MHNPLSPRAVRLADGARRLAVSLQHIRAMRALALAEAASTNDAQQRRLALADARFYRKAERRQTQEIAA